MTSSVDKSSPTVEIQALAGSKCCVAHYFQSRNWFQMGKFTAYKVGYPKESVMPWSVRMRGSTVFNLLMYWVLSVYILHTKTCILVIQYYYLWFLRGNLSTYQELCSLASDLNQPDLIYKFMHLANHNAIWNSKKVSIVNSSSERVL